MQVMEVKPHGVRAGRAAHAIFTQKELVGDGFGLGVIPWMDVTAEGLEDAVLPEAIGVKEATLRMLRDVTKMQRWQARLRIGFGRWRLATQ